MRLVFSIGCPYLAYAAMQQMLYQEPLVKEYYMKYMWHLARRLAEHCERRKRERRDAYLARSADLYDLERRMRDLDRDSRRIPAWMGSTAPHR